MGKSDFYIVVVSKGKKIANASLNWHGKWFAIYKIVSSILIQNYEWVLENGHVVGRRGGRNASIQL